MACTALRGNESPFVDDVASQLSYESYDGRSPSANDKHNGDTFKTM